MDGVLLSWILAFAALGGVGAVLGSALILTAGTERRRVALPWLLAYATGALLASALLGMLPRALHDAPAREVMATVLAGVVLFFLLEKLMLWRHGHGAPTVGRRGAAGPLILLGDAFHNLVDGLVIAAAFLSSPALGVAAGLAVIAHEIPQEVGDFAILLESGFDRKAALLLNSLSASAAIPGALIGYFWLPQAVGMAPYVLALSAASFIYIATADLIPMLHRRQSAAASVLQVGVMLGGIGTVAFLHVHA